MSATVIHPPSWATSTITSGTGQHGSAVPLVRADAPPRRLAEGGGEADLTGVIDLLVRR